MTSYDTMLRTFLSELKMTEEHKKKMIIKLAEALDREKLVAIADINNKLTEDLKGYVTKQWIGQCLPKKFKDAEKIHVGEQKTKLSETKLLVQIGEEGIQTTVGELNDEHDRIKRKNESDESDEFQKELREKLAAHHIEPTQMNKNIFMELQRKIERIEQLESEMKDLGEKYDEADTKLHNLGFYIGNYVKYDKNFKVINVKDSNAGDSLFFNFLKFKDKLKDMIERNIPSATIEHDSLNVIDIK